MLFIEFLHLLLLCSILILSNVVINFIMEQTILLLNIYLNFFMQTKFYRFYVIPFLEDMRSTLDRLVYIYNYGYRLYFIIVWPFTFTIVSFIILECILFMFIHSCIILYYYFFKNNKIYQVYLLEPKKLYEHPYLLFFIRFFSLFPYYYSYVLIYKFVNIFNVNYFSKFSLYPIYFVLFISLPFRFLVKMFTGLSFISMKINVVLVLKFLNLIDYKYEKNQDITKLWLDNVSAFYYSDVCVEALKKKFIISNGVLTLNPPNKEKVPFNEVKFIKEYCSNKYDFNTIFKKTWWTYKLKTDLVGMRFGIKKIYHVTSTLKYSKENAISNDRTHSKDLSVRSVKDTISDNKVENNIFDKKTDYIFIKVPNSIKNILPFFEKGTHDYTSFPIVTNVAECIARPLPPEFRTPHKLSELKYSAFIANLVSLKSEIIKYNMHNDYLEYFDKKLSYCDFIREEILTKKLDPDLKSMFLLNVHFFENNPQLWESSDLYNVFKIILESSSYDPLTGEFNVNTNMVEEKSELFNESVTSLVKSIF